MDSRDNTRSTPLHMASSVKSAESVRLLIEHGAKVDVKNETHSTPLHTVSSWVSTTTTFLSIYHRADANG